MSLLGNIFFYPYIHCEFSKHFYSSSISQPSLSFTISSYIVTLQTFGGCLTFSIIYVQFRKEAQKSTQSPKIEHLFWGFCCQSSSLNWKSLYHIPMIAPHVVMLDRFNHPGHCIWRICPNSASISKESLKNLMLCCLLSSCTANMHKMYESIKITAISGAQKDGALGQGENVCARILWHLSNPTPVQAFPP